MGVVALPRKDGHKNSADSHHSLIDDPLCLAVIRVPVFSSLAIGLSGNYAGSTVFAVWFDGARHPGQTFLDHFLTAARTTGPAPAGGWCTGIEQRGEGFGKVRRDAVFFMTVRALVKGPADGKRLDGIDDVFFLFSYYTGELQ